MLCYSYTHRRRSGWTSGGTHGECRRWVRVEWGGIYGEGCPLSSQLRGLGSVVSFPSGVRGRPITRFWSILKATERSFLYLYDKIWGGGQFVLASPAPNSGGGLVPPVPPWSTPMAIHVSNVVLGSKKCLTLLWFFSIEIVTKYDF